MAEELPVLIILELLRWWLLNLKALKFNSAVMGGAIWSGN